MLILFGYLLLLIAILLGQPMAIVVCLVDEGKGSLPRSSPFGQTTLFAHW
jgi:hypothetical protein